MGRMFFKPRKGCIEPSSPRPYFKNKKCFCGCGKKVNIVVEVEYSCFRGDDEVFGFNSSCHKKYSAQKLLDMKAERKENQKKLESKLIHLG